MASASRTVNIRFRGEKKSLTLFPPVASLDLKDSLRSLFPDAGPCGVLTNNGACYVITDSFVNGMLLKQPETVIFDLLDPRDAQPTKKPAAAAAASSPPLSPSAVKLFSQQLGQVLERLSEGLVERDFECRILVLAALCGEHVLLLGPPGVAKSYLCARLQTLFAADSVKKPFERLLTRFTTPEELFGPVSMQSLKNDQYVRMTDTYLPSADLAFLDEIFKANSAILNSLLTILHERLYDNGSVAASNEYPPDSGELQALYDRFLFKAWVSAYPQRSNFIKLVATARRAEDKEEERGAERKSGAKPSSRAPPIPPEQQLSGPLLLALRAEAARVHMPGHIRALMADFYEALKKLDDNGSTRRLYVSPRKWMKISDALRISAVTHGRGYVDVSDLVLLPYLTWQKHTQRKELWELYLKLVEGAYQAEKFGPSRVSTDSVLNNNWILKPDRSAIMSALGRKRSFYFEGRFPIESLQAELQALKLDLQQIELTVAGGKDASAPDLEMILTARQAASPEKLAHEVTRQLSSRTGRLVARLVYYPRESPELAM